jgi:hypothetical protein
MGFDAPTVLCAGCRPAYWLCRAEPLFRTCFRVQNRVARHPAVPRIELNLVQTICVSSPSEFLRLPLPLPAFRRRASSTQSFFPHRGITVAVHFARGLPNPHYVPPSGFLNLSTACSGPGFAGLFHPATTSRVLSRPGASRLLQPRRLIGDPCPPAVESATLTVQGRWPGPVLSASRLCSTRGRVPRVRLSTSPSVAPLLGFRPPPGTIALALSFGYPKLSAHEVTGLVFRLAAPVPLQRLPRENIDRPVSRPFALLEVSSLPSVSSSRFTRKRLDQILRSVRLPTLRDE